VRDNSDSHGNLFSLLAPYDYQGKGSASADIHPALMWLSHHLKCQFGNCETFANYNLTGSHMEDQELVMNADTDTLLTDKSESDIT
jgi:hypothetical protein